MWSEFEKGFVVGFLEGDGSFILSKHFRDDKKYKTGYQLQPKIFMSNTNKNLLLYIKSILGDKWKISGHVKGKDNCNDSWQLNLNGHANIKSFITQIEPCLVLKQKRASLLLEFCRSRIREIKEHGVPHAHYTSREIEIHKEMKKLNKRGRKVG